ncbi:O-antigen ligase family protein [Acinetobacter sp. ANC 4648]|uniref:O-antigen ligase family protein n=1 Tax=Acinetobacter sp. ANC 4648 TaxID=1977875 RepID=UPI000A33F9D6|nr:O-antigen ligase family protein [Acinetobacter sp. ANC 4648]OTG80700.1 ligase [Acinetobacter sp. ANC 4648]
MKAYFLYLSAMLIAIAWLLPIHQTPWTTFESEILTFLSGLALLGSFLQQKIKIAKPQIIASIILIIPILQCFFGQILYLSNALLSFAYIFSFWLMIVLGYNLSLGGSAREKVLKNWSWLVLIVGLISSLIAILQWLQLSHYFFPYMNLLKGNRPFANFGQPNNLATFLTLGTLACLYFYEKRFVSNVILIPSALILIFSIALTQSRTSWVVGLFILLYWGVKQYQQPKRFGWIKLLLWMAIFIGFISFLPSLNHLLEALSSQQVAETASVIERASSGYLRLDMWSQMLVAISEQPWLGYGWNQTGIAQITAFDAYPSHEWIKSAHNIILDLLIWNGIPIGVLILLYLSFWLYWLNKGVKDLESMIAILMVCAILIHALLEFPIHYAYFLLPLGFLLGVIQARYTRLPLIQINAVVVRVLFLLSALLIAVVYRDYNVYKQQSLIVLKTAPLSLQQQEVMQQKIWLLDQFSDRVWWIELNPLTKMSTSQLQHVGRMVANTASKYDLYKYAQVLAFNGRVDEAKHQLWILKTLHGQERPFEDLLKVDVSQQH